MKIITGGILRERVQFYGLVFLVIVGSVFVVHQFLPEKQAFGQLLIFALVIGLGYTAGLAVLEGIIRLILWKQNPSSRLVVGNIWWLSFCGMVIGFIILEPVRIQHQAFFGVHGTSGSLERFLNLFPVWFILTFFFIQSYAKQTLAQEMKQLRAINQTLEQHAKASIDNAPKSPDQSSSSDFLSEYQPFMVIKGRITQEVDPRIISHIRAEEHYCYIHIKATEGTKVVDMKIALKDALAELPKELFVQIHRSYVVNLSHISHVNKMGRSYELSIDNDQFILPVSRHRLVEVLPRLQQFLL